MSKPDKSIAQENLIKLTLPEIVRAWITLSRSRFGDLEESVDGIMSAVRQEQRADRQRILDRVEAEGPKNQPTHIREKMGQSPKTNAIMVFQNKVINQTNKKWLAALAQIRKDEL